MQHSRLVISQLLSGVYSAKLVIQLTFVCKLFYANLYLGSVPLSTQIFHNVKFHALSPKKKIDTHQFQMNNLCQRKTKHDLSVSEQCGILISQNANKQVVIYLNLHTYCELKVCFQLHVHGSLIIMTDKRLYNEIPNSKQKLSLSVVLPRFDSPVTVSLFTFLYFHLITSKYTLFQRA